MQSAELIKKLKALGLDPANIDISRFDEPGVEDLVAELGTLAGSGDAEASSFYNQMIEAINKFDKT